MIRLRMQLKGNSKKTKYKLFQIKGEKSYESDSKCVYKINYIFLK